MLPGVRVHVETGTRSLDDLDRASDPYHQGAIFGWPSHVEIIGPACPHKGRFARLPSLRPYSGRRPRRDPDGYIIGGAIGMVIPINDRMPRYFRVADDFDDLEAIEWINSEPVHESGEG
jgi:hypothetical protein